MTDATTLEAAARLAAEKVRAQLVTMQREARLADAGEFLDEQFAQGNIRLPERMELGLWLTRRLLETDSQVDARRELARLSIKVARPTARLPALIDLAFEMGQMQTVRDFMATYETLPEPPPIYSVLRLQLELTERAPGLREMAARKAAQLVKLNVSEPEFWERLSRLCTNIAETKTAVLAATNFFNYAGQTDLSRRRLVSALVANGQRRSALRFLLPLLQSPEAKTAQCRGLAELAASCRDFSLAAEFMRRWSDADPKNAAARLYLSYFLKGAGNREQSHEALATLLDPNVDTAALHLKDWQLALDQARALGGASERALAKVASRHFPDEQEFRVAADPPRSFTDLFGSS